MRLRYTIQILTLQLLVALSVISCNSKQEGAKLSSKISNLLLQGRVTDTEGQPVAGAEIFYGVSQEAVETTGETGSFSIEVSSESYSKLLPGSALMMSR